MKIAFPVLVGDIGGTNARFLTISDANGEPTRFEPVRLSEFESLEDAVQVSVLDKTAIRPACMMLAIATPLVGERFQLTNADWIIDPPSLMKRFDLTSLVLFNDFTAQGLAALALPDRDLVFIGDARPRDDAPKVVIGPGTGLGIAMVIRTADRWTVLPGEGGHVDLGPRTPREFAIWPHLEQVNGRLSAEMALSGRGLVNLYRGICGADGVEPALDSAELISRQAVDNQDKRAAEAVQLFISLLARIAGDMALVGLAHGGIYIAGGIAGKLLDAIDHTAFRDAFENKSPHEDILKDISVQIMTHPTAALEGLYRCASRPELFLLEGSARVYTNRES